MGGDLRGSVAKIDKWIKSLEEWLDAPWGTWRDKRVESCCGRLEDACRVYRGLYYGAKIKKTKRRAAKADFKDRQLRAEKAFDVRYDDMQNQNIVMDDVIARVTAKQAAE